MVGAYWGVGSWWVPVFVVCWGAWLLCGVGLSGYLGGVCVAVLVEVCGVLHVFGGVVVGGWWCSVEPVPGQSGRANEPWEGSVMCVSDAVAVGVASGVVGGVVFDPADVGGGNTAVRGTYSVVRRWLPWYASVSGRWGGDWCVLRSDVGKGEGVDNSASVTVASRWDGRVFHWDVVVVHRGWEACCSGSGDWHAMRVAVFGTVNRAVVAYLSSPLDFDCDECRAAGWA